MPQYNLKHYAHIGDAVFELFIRENVILHTVKQNTMHKLTTKFVNASSQAEILSSIEGFFTPEEQEIIRMGHNLPITSNKRNNQKIHRIATSFEVIIGYLYLNDRERLDKLFEVIKKSLNFEESHQG